MDKYLNSALIPIAVGLLTGTVIGVVLFETTPRSSDGSSAPGWG